MQDIRAITLDLDDTLWAIGPVIRRAEQRLHDWFAANYPRIVEQFDAERMHGVRKRVIEEFPEQHHDLTFLRCKVIERIADAAGYASFPVDDAFAVFDRERNDVELFQDVRPALESLQQRFRLIAVTNGNARLDRIGIDDLFDDFVSARMTGVAKPEARIFHAAVAAGGATAAQTVHVGDDPHLDVEGARNSGLSAVWVNRHEHDWPESLDAPDGVVTDLFELQELLADA